MIFDFKGNCFRFSFIQDGKEEKLENNGYLVFLKI